MPFSYLNPPSTAKALIFDCDGTLVDTMGLHRLVWQKLFDPYGFTMTDEWWEEWANVALEPFVRAVIPTATDEMMQKMLLDANVMFNEQLHMLEPLEHVVEVVHRFHGVLPMAVCSGGFREPVVNSLGAVNITHFFDHIVTCDDVVNSKPAPDLYLRGMELLGVSPDEVVVYEDSEIGMASARGAGITNVIDIRG